MLLKCYTKYVRKFGKLSSGYRTGKSQFSFQSQRKAMSKNIQTTKQLCSFHITARLCSKSFKLCFSSTWTENFPIYKLGLEKAEKPDIKLPTFVESWRNKGSFSKTLTFTTLTTLKLLTVWLTTDCGKFLKRWEHQTIFLVSWEMCLKVRKQ